MKKIRFFLLAILCWGGLAIGQTAEQYYQEGVKLKGEKKVPEAVQKFKAALAVKPDHTASAYELGWCYNDLKEYEQAIVQLRKARLGWPAVPKLHFELGWAFEKTSRTDSAVQSYLRCLFYKSDYSLALKQLGTIAYNRDETGKAIEYYNQYEKAAKDSIRDYLYFYRKGFSYNAQKKYDSALLALNQSLRFKKDYANTWLELGFAATRLKKDEDGIAYFNKAIALDPDSHIGYNGIAEIYRDNKKNMDEAMNWYRKSLEVKPRERKACFGMGYCLNSQQKFSEAIPYLRTAVEEEPTYAAAFVELGYSLFKTQANREAEEKLLKALSLNPKNENGRYYLVLLYVAQKEKAKAQKVVDELKAMSSKYANELQTKVSSL